MIRILADRPVLQQVTRPVLAFVVVVTGGVAGFALLGGVGVVEAAFWVIDPTSVELHFLEHEGPERATKTFAIVVRAALVLSSLWIGETALAAAFGGQIGSELERMRTEREIDDLENHVVICGYGIFGRTVAARLREAGRDVVAIELDDAEYERIDTDDVLPIKGDARREEVLREAGIDRADAVVAAIDDSNANIQIAISASQIAPDVRVIVRVGDEMYDTLARRAGADEVVIPEVLSGGAVSDWL